MTQEFETDQAAEILRSAFLPFTCHASQGDYGRTISFVVVNGDETVLIVDEIKKDQFSTGRRLRFIISESRSAISDQGLALDPWTFPSAA